VKTLHELLQEKASGVFALSGEAEAEKIGEIASGFDCAIVPVIGKIKNKQDFLSEIADSLNFPDYFGHNWDAFEECISDPDRVPNQMLVLIFEDIAEFAEKEPEEFKTATDILRDAAEAWSGAGKSLVVLLTRRGIEEFGIHMIRV
jgi:RNAse (barnase) inhibitor barstar